MNKRNDYFMLSFTNAIIASRNAGNLLNRMISAYRELTLEYFKSYGESTIDSKTYAAFEYAMKWTIDNGYDMQNSHEFTAEDKNILVNIFENEVKSFRG